MREIFGRMTTYNDDEDKRVRDQNESICKM